MQTKEQKQTYHRGHLPHLQPPDRIFFITFRLDLKLTPDFCLRMEKRKIEINNSLIHITSSAEGSLIYGKKLFAFTDSYFDNLQSKHNILQEETYSQLVVNELKALDKQMYDLYAFTIMPNHVHILFKPLKDADGVEYSIAKILQNVKGKSARFINLELGRSGKLWQKEYYDHYVRNETELLNIVRYIVRNPFNAGLVDQPKDWQWTWVMQEYQSTLYEDCIREEEPEYWCEKT
jgi:putative transposase